MDIRTEIGKRIKELRLKKGISQELFSRKTGVDRTYISDVENGKRNISIQTLELILTGLEISFKDFFSASVFKNWISESHSFKAIPEDQQFII